MIVVISGRTASGKTTLANALARALGGTPRSFGDYVRYLAELRGKPINRATLQAIGQAEVDADARAFVEAFLKWGGGGDTPLVCDGLRHVSVRDALRAIAAERGRAIAFLHVEADEGRRLARLRDRGDDETTVAAHDAHASEADVRERLRKDADATIERFDDVDRMIADALDALDRLQMGRT